MDWVQLYKTFTKKVSMVPSFMVSSFSIFHPREVVMNHINRVFALFFSSMLALALIGCAGPSFSPELQAKHPCLGKTSLSGAPSPAKSTDVPQAFSHWAGVWEGTWKGQAGTLCHVLIIESIDREGRVRAIYTVGGFYYQNVVTFGFIKTSGATQKLTLPLGGDIWATYTLHTEGGTDALTGNYMDRAYVFLKRVNP